MQIQLVYLSDFLIVRSRSLTFLALQQLKAEGLYCLAGRHSQCTTLALPILAHPCRGKLQISQSTLPAGFSYVQCGQVMTPPPPPAAPPPPPPPTPSGGLSMSGIEWKSSASFPIELLPVRGVSVRIMSWSSGMMGNPSASVGNECASCRADPVPPEPLPACSPAIVTNVCQAGVRSSTSSEAGSRVVATLASNWTSDCRYQACRNGSATVGASDAARPQGLQLTLSKMPTVSR